MTRYQKILVGIFGLTIIWSALSPASGADWFLEIAPVFLVFPVVVYLGRKFTLSNLSYTLILIYLILPIVQAHYGVASVPFGFTLAKWEGIIGRNMFDRLTHFSFGLFWFYPLYELFKQSIGTRPFLNYFIPTSVILAFSSVYEVIELIVRQMASERLSFLFIAAQADFWDTSKDMANTLEGVAVALVMVYCIERYRFKKGITA